MRFSLAIAATAVLFAATGSAALVYNNGTPDQVSGDALTFAIVAEDFTSSGNFNLTSLEFWDLEGSGGYLGSITWLIYSDASGSPGSVVATGVATGGTITHTSTANSSNGFAEFDDVINLAGSISSGSLAITSGTYWVGLHDGALASTSDAIDFYWETTNPGGGVNGKYQDLTVAPAWLSTLQEHAFNISGTPVSSGTPEPSSLLMLGAGIGALTLAWRKRGNA